MSTNTGLPLPYPISVYQGDGYLRAFRIWYRDPDTGERALLDTTGWAAEMVVKTARGAATALLDSAAGDITLTTGIQGTGAVARNLELYIPNDKTAGLPGGLVGVYDLAMTDTSGRLTTYFAERFCVEADV